MLVSFPRIHKNYTNQNELNYKFWRLVCVHVRSHTLKLICVIFFYQFPVILFCTKIRGSVNRTGNTKNEKFASEQQMLLPVAEAAAIIDTFL